MRYESPDTTTFADSRGRWLDVSFCCLLIKYFGFRWSLFFALGKKNVPKYRAPIWGGTAKCQHTRRCVLFISPAPGRSSKLAQTGVEIDTCAFQTGCHLSGAASGMSFELRFFTQLQWREAYVLDNWQLAELPQSGGREFDPRRVHDNLSVPLWVYMRFPVPEHQN